MELQYNYVIFGSDWDLYKFSYSDLLDKDFVEYFDSVESCLGKLSILHKIQFSEKSNRYIKVPFKNIWNPLYYRTKFNDKSIDEYIEKTKFLVANY